MSGSQFSSKGPSSTPDPLSFGLSPRFLSTLSTLPGAVQPSRTQLTSGLPSMNSQSTFTSGTSPAPTLMDSNPPIDLSSSGIPGGSVTVSPGDEFKQNVSLVVNTFIPRVQELTRAIMHDLSRSYEPDTPQSQIAANIMQLKASLAELQSILRQSGVGSLPLSFPDDTTSSAAIRTISVDEISASVSTAYNRANQCRANATIVQNVLEQEVPTRRTT
ncbi:unnamed protein product [Rhizoctonia solani]|uniref:Uncharacterized protein n=1 Tax=Rhizoctonia solani TaxID=456999 RepID=A0A8H3D7V1_9AGAM|nr:unnamed protein product [Rhizoctonia solani]